VGFPAVLPPGTKRRWHCLIQLMQLSVLSASYPLDGNIYETTALANRLHDVLPIKNVCVAMGFMRLEKPLIVFKAHRTSISFQRVMMAHKHVSPRPSRKFAAHVDVCIGQRSLDALLKQSERLPVLDWKFSSSSQHWGSCLS
jgi:hypothetical protein